MQDDHWITKKDWKRDSKQTDYKLNENQNKLNILYANIQGMRYKNSKTKLSYLENQALEKKKLK